MTSPIQVIFFGSPGTGKSHHIKTTVLQDLGIDHSSKNCISTVFHPEYSYGDFMGKLLPNSVGGKVTYSYYAGHFLRALAQAYKNIIFNEPSQNVALIIDEINRGNSASIFGTAFQLLDRQEDDWSTYEVDLSEMEFDTLLKEMGVVIKPSYGLGGELHEKKYLVKGEEKRLADIIQPLNIREPQIKLPPNLSLIATMNNSDNSIYYMDTAFKRRWEWQYVDNDSKMLRAVGVAFTNRNEWELFVTKLNRFIRVNNQFIRKVEDKLIGFWFIASNPVEKRQVQNKIMFYLWDSVFSSNRKPLADLLGIRLEELLTFGDFAKRVDEFIVAIMKIA